MATSLINGETLDHVPVSDRGLQYGDGVFETIRIVAGRPTLWPQHRQRLLAGCSYLRIPLNTQLLEQEMQRLLAANDPVGVAKITITRGSGGRGYRPPGTVDPRRILQFFPLPDELDRHCHLGVKAMVCKHPVSISAALVRFKHLSRIDQVIASAELADSFAEGIMLNEQGQVVEGTRSNLFLVRDDKLITPSLARAGVQGVMRQYLLDCFAARDGAVEEKEFDINVLLNASEVFLCNSVFGVWPVTELINGEIVKQFPIGHRTEVAVGFVEKLFVH